MLNLYLSPIGGGKVETDGLGAHNGSKQLRAHL